MSAIKNKTTKPLRLIRRVYLIWSAFWWMLGFFVLYPYFCLSIWFPFFQRGMGAANQLWCWLFFPMSFLRVRVAGRRHLPRKGQVVYVANHASYLDIPLLTYVLPGFPAFMGKASLGRIPLFGYMFRHLHVVVERGSAKGRAKAMQASQQKLRQGRSIVMFPEGSIHHAIQPGISDFKDGAFRIAIQAQRPVVPMCISYNWYILPDDGEWLPNFYHCEVVILPPIPTAGMAEEDVEKLKNRCRDAILTTLRQRNEKLNLQHEGRT